MFPKHKLEENQNEKMQRHPRKNKKAKKGTYEGTTS